MRILSKFKDYYDCCSSLGIDNTIIYKRELQSYENSEWIDIFMKKFNLNNKYGIYYKSHLTYIRESIPKEYYGLSLFFIGFCGKFYPILKLKVPDYIQYYNLTQIDELKSITEHNEHCSHWFTHYRYNKKSEFEYLIQSIDKIQEQEWNEPFIHFNSPILMMNFKHGDGNSIIFSNAQLNKYEFQKIKDPYIAWQEITMYLDNIIPKQVKETISISDKDRITGHGFDKWSFRKKVR